MPQVISVAGTTEFSVNTEHFGVNAVYTANTTDGLPSGLFTSSLEVLGARHVRFPGGQGDSAPFEEKNNRLVPTVEGTDWLNIVAMTDGQLIPELVSFLEWCRDPDGNPETNSGVKATLVIPTKHLSASDYADFAKEIEEFSRKVVAEYGDVVEAFEIGNEYWGASSKISEEAGYSDYATGELDYAKKASLAATALEQGMLDAGMPSSDQPSILVQMATPNAGSNYHASKSGGSYSARLEAANREIIDNFTDNAKSAIDGVVEHYYYKRDYDSFGVNEDAKQFEFNFIGSDFEVWREEWDSNRHGDLDLQITEWNVDNDNWGQHGLKAASVVLEQFEYMLRGGVDAAQAWAVNHKTTTALAGGNENESPVRLTPAGTIFQWMAESLVTEDGGLQLLDLSGENIADFEINAFQDAYRTVVYVSSRNTEFGANLSLDLAGLADNEFSWSARQLGIDTPLEAGASGGSDTSLGALGRSDGLNEQWDYDAEGNQISGTRLGRREIDEDERQALVELFGDFLSENQIWKIKEDDNGDKLTTYFPPIETIFLLPGVSNPTGLHDFYFAAEVDVEGRVDSDLTINNLTEVNLRFDPYEVVEITIESSRRIEGDAQSDNLVGGYGCDLMFGDGGADYLHGGSGTDRLFGGDHSDVLNGGLDNDTLFGGGGDDLLIGSDGHDSLHGATGNDTFSGGSGNDSLYGDEGSDSLVGGNGADYVHGGNGDDELFGGDHSDVLNGGQDNDTLFGGAGADTLSGGDGTDYLRGGTGADVLDGGSGIDRVNYHDSSAAVTINLNTGTFFGGDADGDMLLNIENVYGSKHNDRLEGNSEANRLYGKEGNDTLSGGAGSDILYGGLGEDVFEFRSGNGQDTIFDFADNTDTIGFDVYGITTASQAMSFASQSGAHVVFDFGEGDQVTIRDTTLAALQDDLYIM